MVNRFLQGTLVLTIAGFVVKAIGSINWILLSRVLGGEGIGIYQMAFPIYLLALQVSSAGIPIAISIVTAEKVARCDYTGAKKVFTLSFNLLFITGLLCSLLMYFGSDWLISSGYIIDNRAYYSLIALSPAIFFVTLISCYRGYLQGWQLMTPTAISQIIEQLLRVVVMLGAGYLLLPYGLAAAAGGASLGAGIGAFGALVVLMYYYYKLPRLADGTPLEGASTSQRANELHNKTTATDNDTDTSVTDETTSSDSLSQQPVIEKESSGSILYRLIKLAIPISLASVMLPLVANLDLFIVPRRLAVAGFSTGEATELFGYLTGMAVPLINLATIITAALATSLVPAISNAKSLNDAKGVFYRTSGAMRITFMATVPFTLMLYVLAEPVVTVIYNAPKAAEATQILAIAIFFLGLHQVTTGILQGLGKPTLPVINMGIAAVCKVILNWNLTAIPWLGIAGASYATVADIGVAALLNLIWIKRYTGYFLDISILWKNIVSAVIMGIAMYFIYGYMAPLMPMFLAMVISAAIGGVIYVIIMVMLKGLDRHDGQRMPIIGRFFK